MTRRSTRTTPIPEETQKPLRRRLRSLRIMRGLRQAGFGTNLSASSVGHYERYDISRMRLGDLYAMAERFEITLHELIEYLFDINNDKEYTLSADSQFIMRSNALISALPPDMRKLALSLLQDLVNYHTEQLGQLSQPRNHYKAKETVQKALLEQRHATTAHE